MDRVVSVSLRELQDPAADLSAKVERAYGPDGLGIMVVTGVPEFVDARARLLPQAASLARLPAGVLRSLEDAESSYSFGWSHGKEVLQGGKPDTLKGSFYANPLHDRVTDDAATARLHPSYARENVWPKEHLPDLEFAFKHLGQLMIRVGHLVAQRCDQYILHKTGNRAAACCADVIARSPCPKGRLLHYFPAQAAPAAGEEMEQWCGWHNDHGSLTGLTSAMFLDAQGRPVANPDPEAGLYIRDRADKVIKVSIPKDAIAYQMGECLQILSGGLLNATPHYVRGANPSLPAARGVSRNTLAIFMQPHWDDVLRVPAGVSPSAIKPVVAWKDGQTFGEFTNVKLSQYYEDTDGSSANAKAAAGAPSTARL